MNLLKIGTLNIPRNRWEDALSLFDNIIVFCLDSEIELENRNITYIKFKQSNIFSRYLSKLLLKIITKYKGSKFLINKSVIGLRFLNKNLLKEISGHDFDYVHSSYNDFDESGLLTMLLKPYIKTKTITRAYKENRPEKNYIEEFNFEIADRIILNSKENERYFRKKYKTVKWDKKEIITGLDEDYRNSKIIKTVILEKKLSETDGKKHVVILAGRVMSDDTDKRSGTRLYYIPLIKELIEAGLIVHLHTMRIINDKKGVNQYEVLRNKYSEKFYIEGPLDFEADSINAYRELSRYDYGVLHNISEENNYVSAFDKVNIPHRFYEYQIAEVIPIIRKGDTILMERIFEKDKHGIIYEQLKDLVDYDSSSIIFFKETFLSYITSLYGKN